MSSEPAALPRTAPDRVFAWTAALVLGIGFVFVVTAHALLGRAAEHQGRAAELALVSASEASSARSIVTMLERMSAPADGADVRAAQSRLAWDVERLIEHEDRRLQLTQVAPGQAQAAGSDLMRAAASVREIALRNAVDREAATELKVLFEGQVLPQLDLITVRHRAEADEARRRSQMILVGSVAAHFACGALMLAGVVLPARRRIDAWVARTRETDRENRFRLLHDPRTGMPNAAYLEAHLTRLAQVDTRRVSQTAILRIDIDRLRSLRDTLGRHTAEEIVRISARRLQQCLRPQDFAAQLGLDSFVVVAADLAEGNDAATIAGRIQAALSKPFSIRGGARRLSCSIGVTLLSDDRPEAARILSNAEIALAAAQAAGAGGVHYFREGLRREVERRETLFGELLAGLDRDQIVPFFQPQVDLATGALVGFEALVRWQHPEQGLLEPAAFLDFAEQSDLTERLGEVVLTRSLHALKCWDTAGLMVPRVGVNFALAQLRDPRLIEKIKWEVERYDIEPCRIAIEVLETVLIKSDTDIVVRNLRGLASVGFHVELDDFGTGHASISNLRRFMVDRIKIDRSFVAGIETDPEQQKLTASMIAMAHALGITTLAEGVETPAAAAMLRRLGCDHLQGFVVSRPLSPGETLPWLQAFGSLALPVPGASSPVKADPNTP